MRVFPSVLAWAWICLTSLNPSFGRSQKILYVENTNSGDVTLIRVPEHRVIGTIDVGLYPDDVTASHAGDVVYVNRTESAGVPRFPRVGESGEVIAISTATDEILWRVRVGGMPHHMTVSHDDRYVFVPLFNTFFLAVVDTQQRKVVARVPVGYGPHGTKLSPDGKRLYVGTMFTDHVTVVDVATLEPLKMIPFDDAVRPFAITRDERRMYVQLSRLHGFVVTDLENDAVIRTVAMPPLPDALQRPRFFPHTVNHGMALTADNKYLYVAASIADYVAVYTVPDLELVKTIPVGREPNPGQGFPLPVVMGAKRRLGVAGRAESDAEQGDHDQGTEPGAFRGGLLVGVE